MEARDVRATVDDGDGWIAVMFVVGTVLTIVLTNNVGCNVAVVAMVSLIDTRERNRATAMY